MGFVPGFGGISLFSLLVLGGAVVVVVLVVTEFSGPRRGSSSRSSGGSRGSSGRRSSGSSGGSGTRRRSSSGSSGNSVGSVRNRLRDVGDRVGQTERDSERVSSEVEDVEDEWSSLKSASFEDAAGRILSSDTVDNDIKREVRELVDYFDTVRSEEASLLEVVERVSEEEGLEVERLSRIADIEEKSGEELEEVSEEDERIRRRMEQLQQRYDRNRDRMDELMPRYRESVEAGRDREAEEFRRKLFETARDMRSIADSSSELSERAEDVEAEAESVGDELDEAGEELEEVDELSEDVDEEISEAERGTEVVEDDVVDEREEVEELESETGQDFDAFEEISEAEEQGLEDEASVESDEASVQQEVEEEERIEDEVLRDEYSVVDREVDNLEAEARMGRDLFERARASVEEIEDVVEEGDSREQVSHQEIEQLRGDIRQQMNRFASEGGGDRTFQMYYAGVVEKLLEFEESSDLNDEDSLNILRSTEDLLSVLGKAMSTRKNIKVFDAAEVLDTGNVVWRGGFDVEEFRDMKQDPSSAMERFESDLTDLDNFLGDHWSDVNNYDPAYKVYSYLVELDRSFDSASEQAAFVFVMEACIDAVVKAFDREELRKVMNAGRY